MRDLGISDAENNVIFLTLENDIFSQLDRDNVMNQ